MDHGARFNEFLDERQQVFRIAVRNLLNSDSPKPFWLKHFDSNGNKHLRGVALATCGRNGVHPIRNSDANTNQMATRT